MNKKRGVKVKKHLGISISVGIVAAAWVLIAEKVGVPAWITFVGWSIFFFAGADYEACTKSLPCIILGAVLGYLAILAQTTLGTTGITSALIVFVLAFAMTIAKGLPIFSTAAATFIGCANYFATGSLYNAIVLTSIGLILGVITITMSSFLDSIIIKDEKVILNEGLE